jgi:uncharacterized membrane protein
LKGKHILSNLFIILFEGRHTSDEALLRVAKMSGNWEADIDDFIAVTRGADGNMRIKNSEALTAAGMLGGVRSAL